MTTPHGKAWGLSSPGNGFEGYALCFLQFDKDFV